MTPPKRARKRPPARCRPPCFNRAATVLRGASTVTANSRRGGVLPANQRTLGGRGGGPHEHAREPRRKRQRGRGNVGGGSRSQQPQHFTQPQLRSPQAQNQAARLHAAAASHRRQPWQDARLPPPMAYASPLQHASSRSSVHLCDACDNYTCQHYLKPPLLRITVAHMPPSTPHVVKLAARKQAFDLPVCRRPPRWKAAPPSAAPRGPAPPQTRVAAATCRQRPRVGRRPTGDDQPARGILLYVWSIPKTLPGTCVHARLECQAIGREGGLRPHSGHAFPAGTQNTTPASPP